MVMLEAVVPVLGSGEMSLQPRISHPRPFYRKKLLHLCYGAGAGQQEYNSVYILKVMAIGIIGATIEFFAFARPASGCADY